MIFKLLRACWRLDKRLPHLLAVLLLVSTLERATMLTAALAWSTPWLLHASVALVSAAGLARLLHARTHLAVTVAGMRVATRSLLYARHERDPVTVMEGVHELARAIVSVGVPLCASALTSAAAVCVLIAQQARPLVVALVGTMFTMAMALTLVARARANRAMEAVHRAYEEVLGDVSDASRGWLEIVASGAEDHFLAAADVRTHAYRLAGGRAFLAEVFGGRGALLGLGAVAGALAISRLGTRSDWFGEGVLVVASIPSFTGVLQGLFELSRSRLKLEQLAMLTSCDPGQRGGAPLEAPITSLAWRDVSFSFEPTREVLRRLNCEVRRGQLVGLRGPNGSGKSTALALALGVHEVTKGRVEINGKDLDTLDIAAVRAKISFLPQRPHLPMDRDVVSAMNFPLTCDDHTSALRLVGLLDRLGPNPSHIRADTLSAGERQRLALARVFGREADVYILDEPDANLDTSGVEMVATLLSELARQHVVIVAAHTSELLSRCDLVVDLAPERDPRAGQSSAASR